MKVVPGPTTIAGIDVSKYQKTIDWAAVAAEYEFAIIRCSDANAQPEPQDPRFAENWRGAREAGMVRGVYQYLRPAVDVREQVELMVQMIADAGGLEADDLPPAVDVEKYGNEGCTPAQFRAATAEWIQLCEELLGRRPIVYTGPSVQLKNDLGAIEGITDYPLWVAHYRSVGPWIVEPWTGWQFWQHSGEGRVPGIRGDVDLNLFNGSRAELQALIGRSVIATSPAAPPAPPTEFPTMNALVYLIHADPSQNAKYIAAARDAGHEIELINVTLGNGSSVYRQLARDVGTLEGLLRRYPPRGAHDVLVIATFSAGYGFPAELLKLDPAAADQIDCLVFLDSHHAGLDPDGTAKDFDLTGLVSFGQMAKDGPEVCWLGHADVPTVGYASTTMVADELARLTGLEFEQQQTGNRLGAVRIAELGGLRIEGYNQVGPAGTRHSWSQAQIEHGRALTTWGPPFLARALVELNGRRDAPDPEPPPDTLDTELSHGERAAAWAMARVGTAEQPLGSNRGPEVSAWLLPCQRDGYGPEFGRWLASAGANWCAALACAAHVATRMPEDPPAVHGYRASGLELENDAKATGAWHDVAEVLTGTWSPGPGDYAIYQSGNGTPEEAWRRHVVIVAEPEGPESFCGVGGNESNKVTHLCGRRYDHPKLLGFVELPRVEDLDEDWTPLKRAVELDALGWQFVSGMDAFDELLAELQEADPRDDGEDVVGLTP